MAPHECSQLSWGWCGGPALAQPLLPSQPQMWWEILQSTAVNQSTGNTTHHHHDSHHPPPPATIVCRRRRHHGNIEFDLSAKFLQLSFLIWLTNIPIQRHSDYSHCPVEQSSGEQTAIRVILKHEIIQIFITLKKLYSFKMLSLNCYVGIQR